MFFDELPIEKKVEIFELLDARTLAKCARVATSWNAVIKKEDLIKKAADAEFKQKITEKVPEEMQQKIIQAIKEYKGGDLILIEHIYEEVGTSSVQLMVGDSENTALIKAVEPMKWIQAFFKNILRDHILDDGHGLDGGDGPVIWLTMYSSTERHGERIGQAITTIGIRANFVSLFQERWSALYREDKFDSQYYNQLTQMPRNSM
jgi:hypothetical protein